MRKAIGIAALVLLVGCSAETTPDNEPLATAKESATRTVTPTVSTTPSTQASTPTTTPKPTPTTIKTPTPRAKPAPTVVWSLEQGKSGRCGFDSDCVGKPSLAAVPPLGKRAAVLRVRGMWKADLSVPHSLGHTYVTCGEGDYGETEFIVVSDEGNTSEYGLKTNSAWMRLAVSDDDQDGYSAEATLAFDYEDEPLEVTDSTSWLGGDEPVLQWDWSRDRRVVRFSFRAPSHSSIGGTGPVDLIGSTLVSGSIRCP